MPGKKNSKLLPDPVQSPQYLKAARNLRRALRDPDLGHAVRSKFAQMARELVRHHDSRVDRVLKELGAILSEGQPTN